MSYKILCKSLSDVNRDFIKYLEPKLMTYNLTLTMWRCLLIINNNSCCNLKYIAQSLSLDSALITRNIRKLENLNYISKTPRENDNRFFDLILTDVGQRILKEIDKFQDTWYSKITNSFNDNELNNLIFLMKKLSDNID